MWRFSKALTLILALAGPARAQEVVITFGGDVNFARSREAPLPDAVRKFWTVPLPEVTADIAAEWNGDINFINVETVVSARDGAVQGKTFVFRSHPDSFRHLMDLGVNAFALANNHAYDHGWQGMTDTLAFFEGEDRADRPLLFAGVGRGDAAFAPKIITANGLRIALSAASFGSGSFSPSGGQVGMAYLSIPSQYNAVLRGLRDADADIRILSLHYGTENMIQLNAGQEALFRRGLEEAGVNLVLGHHPHVVRPVEAEPELGRAVFYSLGNFLFIGGAEKDSAPLGLDYGLMGRAYFNVAGGKVRLSALEALPLRGVHHIPVRMTPDRAARTLDHLNRLSQSQVGGRAVSFSPAHPQAQHGLACFAPPFGPRAAVACCARSTGPNVYCDLPDLM